MSSLKDVARTLGMEVHVVREILKENTRVRVAKGVQDRVFQTARKLGYNFKKLKIGKRMEQRKQTIQELLSHILGHPHWSREEIVKYLKNSCDMVDRVQRKAFHEEFGE